MTDLTDYIATRKQDLIAQRDRLQAELHPILAELDEIHRAEQALAKTPRPRGPRLALPGDETIKGLTLRALAEAEGPLSANELLERVQVDAGKPIERTTFSPQLSRLCRAGQVVRTGMAYRIGPGDPNGGRAA